MIFGLFLFLFFKNNFTRINHCKFIHHKSHLKPFVSYLPCIVRRHHFNAKKCALYWIKYGTKCSTQIEIVKMQKYLKNEIVYMIDENPHFDRSNSDSDWNVRTVTKSAFISPSSWLGRLFPSFNIALRKLFFRRMKFYKKVGATTVSITTHSSMRPWYDSPDNG